MEWLQELGKWWYQIVASIKLIGMLNQIRRKHMGVKMLLNHLEVCYSYEVMGFMTNQYPI